MFGLVPGDEAGVNHAAQNFFLARFGQLGVGAEGGVGSGGSREAGQDSGFGQCEVVGGLAEISLGGFFYAVGRAAKTNTV